MNFDITVITPVYNISEYLPRFFESFKNQTYQNYKLYVVDDGSVDDSLKICYDHAANDDRIEVFSLNHVGVIKARDYALQKVYTKYVVYADGDDYVESGYLMHLRDGAIKYDADLVASRVIARKPDKQVMSVFSEMGYKFVQKNDFYKELPVIFDERRLNYLYGKIYKTALLKEVDVKTLNVEQGEDTVINFRYIQKINNILLIDDIDYNYIKYDSRSITSYLGKDSFERLFVVNEILKEELKKVGLFSSEMEKLIIKRDLLSAKWTVERAWKASIDKNYKEKLITDTLNNRDYVEVYKFVKKEKLCFDFDIIKPQSGKSYIRKMDRYVIRYKIKARLSIILCRIIGKKSKYE